MVVVYRKIIILIITICLAVIINVQSGSLIASWNPMTIDIETGLPKTLNHYNVIFDRQDGYYQNAIEFETTQQSIEIPFLLIPAGKYWITVGAETDSGTPLCHQYFWDGYRDSNGNYATVSLGGSWAIFPPTNLHFVP